VAVMFGWEGKRKFGVTLAMCHRLCGIFRCSFNGLRKEDEHLAYTAL